MLVAERLTEARRTAQQSTAPQLPARQRRR